MRVPDARHGPVEQPTDPDRLGALRTALQGGGVTTVIHAPRNNVFMVSAWRTVYAVDDPVNQVAVRVGVGLNDVFSFRRCSDRC